MLSTKNRKIKRGRKKIPHCLLKPKPAKSIETPISEDNNELQPTTSNKVKQPNQKKKDSH